MELPFLTPPGTTVVSASLRFFSRPESWDWGGGRRQVPPRRSTEQGRRLCHCLSAVPTEPFARSSSWESSCEEEMGLRTGDRD